MFAKDRAEVACIAAAAGNGDVFLMAVGFGEKALGEFETMSENVLLN